ncbi:hypothetical protein D3C80_1838860 [compost metagenome]
MRRDKRSQHDLSGIHHQFCHFTHATDVFTTIIISEAQITAQPVANVIAIEQIRADTLRMQRLLQRASDGGFPRTRKPGEPQYGTAMAMLFLAICTRNRVRMPDNILIF